MTAAADGAIDRDAALLARLDVLMRDQQTWKETGLTIGALAARAAIPEYRLRRLINQRLGFRNFTAFLNEYRLTAAAARLGDREQARVPVLTIALDLGWGSIGPFNRAFRARFGMTPSDYRRARAAPPPWTHNEGRLNRVMGYGASAERIAKSATAAPFANCDEPRQAADPFYKLQNNRHEFWKNAITDI